MNLYEFVYRKSKKYSHELRQVLMREKKLKVNDFIRNELRIKTKNEAHLVGMDSIIVGCV